MEGEVRGGIDDGGGGKVRIGDVSGDWNAFNAPGTFLYPL